MYRTTSGGTKPPVDIDVKVVFYYENPLLKRNFKSMSTGGLVLHDVSPCTVIQWSVVLPPLNARFVLQDMTRVVTKV